MQKISDQRVKVFEGNDCISNMIQYIDSITKPIVCEKENGKQYVKARDIYFYAHNGKGFDNFLVLEQ